MSCETFASSVQRARGETDKCGRAVRPRYCSVLVHAVNLSPIASRVTIDHPPRPIGGAYANASHAMPDFSKKEIWLAWVRGNCQANAPVFTKCASTPGCATGTGSLGRFQPCRQDQLPTAQVAALNPIAIEPSGNLPAKMPAET